jgi:hypothetical protein
MKNLTATFIILILLTQGIYAQDWRIIGNNGTSDATNYVGTDDGTALNFATDYTNLGLFMMRLTTAGELGIGTTSPSSWLHVAPLSTNESFRTNSSATNIGDSWRMLRGTDEMLRIWFANTANALNMHASRGVLRLSSGSNTGATNEAIEILGGTGADAGFVGIGDYTAFGAAHLLHAHESTAAKLHIGL